MASIFTLGVVVRVIDRFSAPFRSFRAMLAGHRDQLKQIGQDMKAWGQGALIAGGVVGAALLAPAVAFAKLEDASTQLRVNLMDSRGGLSAAFAAINAQTIELGNQLPGTTADFIRMANILASKGQSPETIVGGLLKATAHLGVVLKQAGVSYEETAGGVAIFSNALGIASKDMMPFTDIVQRAVSLGVEFTALSYAIERSAPSLKVLGIQGFEASKNLVPLFALLHRQGIGGERAGTGLERLFTELSDPLKMAKVGKMLAGVGIQFNMLDKSGKFIGIRNMIGELEKLQRLNPAQFALIIQELFGGGGDASIAKALIMSGLAGYDRVAAEMQNKASLDMKIAEVLKTLGMQWEAATGNWTNAMAEFGKVISPELKAAVVSLGEGAAALQKWITAHPTLVKWMGIALIIFTGLVTVVGGLAIAISAVIAAIGGSVVAAGIVAITLLSAAVAALYVWWDDLADAVKRFWDALRGGFGLFNAFAKGWAWLTGARAVEIDYNNLAPDFAEIGAANRGREYSGSIGPRSAVVNFGGVTITDRDTADYFAKRVAKVIGELSDGATTAYAVP